MKYILLCMLSVFSFTSFAQDTASVAAMQNNMKTISAKLDSVGKVAAANGDSLKKLKEYYNTSISIDSTALELFITNIDSAFYCHSLFKSCKSGKVGTVKTSDCPGDCCDQGWPGWVRFGIVMIFLLIFWFYAFTKLDKSAMCRDISYDKDHKLLPVEKRPYSYSRVQLFWWTIIIVSCYAFCLAATGVLIPLNATAAILLGFSVVVVAGGKMIDKKQIDTTQTGTRSQDYVTEGFLTDILSDNQGLSIHRFQAIIFNIIFGIGYICFFINAFFCTHKYPLIDFYEWQLTLLGLSSATYLAMKTTENNSTTTTTTTMGTSTTTSTTNTGTTAATGTSGTSGSAGATGITSGTTTNPNTGTDPNAGTTTGTTTQ